jgi:hypothetical protein
MSPGIRLHLAGLFGILNCSDAGVKGYLYN